MKNHSWGEPNRLDEHNTLRICTNCGMVKRSRHEPGKDPAHWTEFEKYGLRMSPIGKTPECK